MSSAINRVQPTLLVIEEQLQGLLEVAVFGLEVGSPKDAVEAVVQNFQLVAALGFQAIVFEEAPALDLGSFVELRVGGDFNVFVKGKAASVNGFDVCEKGHTEFALCCFGRYCPPIH